MRIFVGLTDVANITATYAEGFRALGHEVFSAVWNRSYFYPDSQYDLVIDDRKPGTASASSPLALLRMAGRLLRTTSVLRCDTAVLFAPAVLPTHVYYPVLSLLNKKIISAFWGSDIRYWYAFAEEMTLLGAQDEIAPFFEYARTRSGGGYFDKQRTIRTAEKYSDLIISQPDCGQLQRRPYMRAHVPLNLRNYKFNVPGRTRPLILHAPSVPAAKGTDVVLAAIRELEQEGVSFDFRLIEKMPNAELRALLSDSDILVDELYSATVGGLSAEGMATGNAVLVRYMSDYSKVPPGCPAVNVNKSTVKNVLRDLILDVPKRMDLANKGRPYVERVNDHIKVCADLLDWMRHKDTIAYDFCPTFFQRFVMPEELLNDEKRATSRRRREFFRTLLSTGTTRTKQ